mmetsp:Transcript_24509/g.81469  ORF Transcript_24509/g.81469 Transcript_24509/m.81469 type:complete len:356 (-) Transcript_24509:411-1478(-)
MARLCSRRPRQGVGRPASPGGAAALLDGAGDGDRPRSRARPAGVPARRRLGQASALPPRAARRGRPRARQGRAQAVRADRAAGAAARAARDAHPLPPLAARLGWRGGRLDQRGRGSRVRELRARRGGGARRVGRLLADDERADGFRALHLHRGHLAAGLSAVKLPRGRAQGAAGGRAIRQGGGRQPGGRAQPGLLAHPPGAHAARLAGAAGWHGRARPDPRGQGPVGRAGGDALARVHGLHHHRQDPGQARLPGAQLLRQGDHLRPDDRAAHRRRLLGGGARHRHGGPLLSAANVPRALRQQAGRDVEEVHGDGERRRGRDRRAAPRLHHRAPRRHRRRRLQGHRRLRLHPLDHF